MALERTSRPLAQCLRCTRHERISFSLPVRTFTSSAPIQDVEARPESSRPAFVLDPYTVSSPRYERKLMREQKKVPIGSRRRRAAMRTTSQIPFTQLPYQCFQEARAFLQEDRKQKLGEIEVQRGRIERLMDTVPVAEAEIKKKEHRLKSMRERLEHVKILADINDPLIKKKFEDGQGDMSKPIYRHLADKQWRAYKRPLLLQRITQMNVIPDILPSCDPVLSTSLAFPARDAGGPKRKNVQHGDFVPSRLSERPPILTIQPYTKGEKLVTIAVVNPDVPNVATDSFASRVHFLACNVPISPTAPLVKTADLDPETQIAHAWLPAYAQKGAPYQRMSIFVLEQAPTEKVPAGSAAVAASQRIDVAKLKEYGRYTRSRENFSLRSFVDKNNLTAVGVDLFRTQWDEGTAGVMRRAGIVGADVEFRRKRIEPLPYKRLKGERFR